MSEETIELTICKSCEASFWSDEEHGLEQCIIELVRRLDDLRDYVYRNED